MKLLFYIFSIFIFHHFAFAFEANIKDYEKFVEPFLKKHCYSCHGPKKQKGKLRLDTLSSSIIDEDSTEKWIEVVDSLSLGEMPPEDEPIPKIADQEKVMNWITLELKKARRHLQSSGGRVLLRRLNRQEYTNTIKDIFNLDFVEGEGPMATLSPEGKIDGFNKMSKALMLDPSLMQNYYQLSVDIANRAIQTEEPEIKSEKRRFEYEATEKNRAINYITKKRSVVVTDSGLKVYEGGLRTYGELKHSFNKRMIPELGRYTIRIRAGAFKGDRAEPIYMKLSSGGLGTIKQWEVTGTPESPDIYEVTIDMAPQGNGELNLSFVNGTGFGGIDQVLSKLNKELNTLSKSGKRLEAERLRSRLALEGAAGIGVTGRINPDTYYLDRLPYLYADYIEIEGPLKGPWPPKSMVTLFPKGYESTPKTEKTAKLILSNLIRKAFRKPLEQKDLNTYLNLFKKQTKLGNTFEEALKVSISAILCSPDFLYLFEANPDDQKRSLNSFEFASRLSYFLWSSMPDTELMKDAKNNLFQNRSSLNDIVDRLLSDDKVKGFYNGFVNQWLKVSEFDHFEPDQRTYKEYFENANIGIAEDMKQEPILFIKQIINSNSSMLDCLKSDWSMLNQRLANYYGIPNVTHSDFQKVKLPAHSNRGGIITMAGFHKWGSDGNRTKPVERGKYVLDVLFNSPAPPPPPNAGEIEPNIKGEKLTVRERLLQHQQIPSCAVCHKKIDPYGLGIENFNVIGKWRDQQDGESFRNKGPKMIVAGKFPNGVTFNNFQEYQEALFSMKDRFVHGLTEKMLTYALGRTIEASDLGEIEDIVKRVEQQNYSMRSLIKEIVASDAFKSK